MSTIPTLSTRTPASDASSDDGYISSESEANSLDDILRNSPMRDRLGLAEDEEESLPKEDDSDATPDKSSEEEVPKETDDEAENEVDDGEETEEETNEEESGEDDKSTQDTNLPSEEEIDWDYKIPIKVDGKTEYVSLEEVRKGYSTDQHLSQKGRELGELKKQIETERTEKLTELIHLGTMLNQNLSGEEERLAAEYHSINADLQKARDEGDTYTVRELRDKLEESQARYWEVRNGRELQIKVVAEKIQEQDKDNRRQLVAKFQQEIPTKIPDFNEKVAKDIREFAIKEGIPEGLLDVVFDASVVKFIDDYRRLKTAKETGAAKRKTAPTQKSIPIKKGKSIDEVKATKQKTNRDRVLTGTGSPQDQLDFLKNISSISKKL